MKLLDSSIFNNDEGRITDPQVIKRILRDRTFETAALLPYVDMLSDRYGIHLPYFRTLALHGYVFQGGQEHLKQRRSVAAAFSAEAAQALIPLIEEGVDACIARLGLRTEADLFSEFCEPSFLPVMRAFIGLPHGKDKDVIALIRTANDASHPMLSLAAIKRIEGAMAGLANCLAEHGEDDGTLIGALRARYDDETQCVGIALPSLIAAHTMVQTLSRAIYGLLLGDRARWTSLASGVEREDVDQLLSLFASTQTLVRVAGDDAKIDGCPVAKGSAVVLDVVAANKSLRARCPSDGAGLAFGAGVHKCPGEAISRLFIAYALPALARTFPDAGLHRDRVTHHVTPLVRYPTSLLCELAGQDRRANTRLFEVLKNATARAAINDDTKLGPPSLHTHLTAIQERSGHDLSTAIKIARNAMFFMSGKRHAEARKQVSVVLGGNRIARWQPLIHEVVTSSLDRLELASDPDLIRDFAEPMFYGVMQPLLGVCVKEQEVFNQKAPILQDVLEPLLPTRRILELQQVFSALLDQLLEPPEQVNGQVPLLRHLYDANLEGFDRADCRALTLVLYGASYNLIHTFGNIMHQVLEGPDRVGIAEDGMALARQIDLLIGSAASPRYIYRVARVDTSIDGVEVRQGDTLRMQLLSINHGVGNSHLSFGHGLHHCVGAAVTRHVLRTAVSEMSRRFPDVCLLPGGVRYHAMSQTVAPSHLPCRLIR